MNNVKTHSIELAGKQLTFETGRFAHLADGAIVATYGELVLFFTAGMTEKGNPEAGFFPLTVDFLPKFYAAGRIKGSRFIKRETRPPESAILTARMIDRTMRPLFPKGVTNEVQIIGNLWQTDETVDPATLGITAASMAIQLAGLPIEAPFAGIRIGIDENGEFIVDPTYEQAENGKLNLIVAGTVDAITMVEGGADLVDNATMLKALEFGHKLVKQQCEMQAEFVKQFNVQTRAPQLRLKAEGIAEAVGAATTEADFDAIGGTTKSETKSKIKAVEEKVKAHYADQLEAGEISEKALMGEVNTRFAANMRARVFATGKRLDGRGVDDVRPLHIETGIFNRLHGSALFQRGETQSFSVLTVGTSSEGQTIDDPERPEYQKNYLHHYNFPPYSVGEVRRLRGTGRREIGHGMLAERALSYVIPKREDGFPYTLRVVSEITTCNGSSSMASVCGSTMSLMDGGIELKAPISGVAMGLLMDKATGEYRILTDIQGFEDFDGDMDLKITGSDTGITAIQMDIKVKGLKVELLAEALEKGQTARKTILDAMITALPKSREEMSSFAPRIISFQIDKEDIRLVIGKGGETIQKLTADFEVKIDIEDDGTILIAGTDQAKSEGAKMTILTMLYKPQPGDIFEAATVKSIQDFGVFVEYLPGKEALVHVSEMANERVEHPSDVVKEGDVVRVQMLGSDKMGRVKLSMKSVL